MWKLAGFVNFAPITLDYEPRPLRLSIPDSSGKFIYSPQKTENNELMTSLLSISGNLF